MEVFDRACIRLMRGDLWHEIRDDEGLSCWSELDERGRLPEHTERWQAVKAAMSATDQAEIRETARVLLRTAQGKLAAREVDGVTPKGTISTKTIERAASTAQAGAALLYPAVHGKGAGRGPAVTVNAHNAVVGNVSSGQLPAFPEDDGEA